MEESERDAVRNARDPQLRTRRGRAQRHHGLHRTFPNPASKAKSGKDRVARRTNWIPLRFYLLLRLCLLLALETSW